MDHEFYESVSKEWVEETAKNIAGLNKEEKRSLKSWAVKLPEEVIEEIEKLHKASGLRFKNEFIEYLLKQYKVNLFKEGEQTEDILHPEVIKNSSSDLYEVDKLTQMMHELFVHRLEKESITQYELEHVKKDYHLLLKQHKALQDIAGEQRHSSYLDEYVRKEIRHGFGHRLFVGVSGAGKTNAAKCEIKKAMEQKRQIIVVDPTREYDAFVEQFNGTTYRMHCDGGERINPFEIRSSEVGQNVSFSPLTEKTLDILNVLELMMNRSLSARERKIATSCIERMYTSYGITRQSTQNAETMPTLESLAKELRQSGDGISLADELDPYIYGVFPYFNGARNFHIYESPIVLFNCHDTEREISSVSAYITLSFIYNLIKQGVYQNTLLVIDQMWLFMQRPQLRDLLVNVLKEAKKYRLDVLLITQTIEDVINDDVLMMNIATKVYFKQHVKGVNRLVEERLLSTSEMEFLLTRQPGEALVDGKLKFMMTFEYLDEKKNSNRNILY